MNDTLPKRKQIRLKSYDYTKAGVYFLTVCTANRAHILSSVQDSENRPHIELTAIGQAVKTRLERFPGIEKYVIMPNHVHLLVNRETDSKRDVSQDVRSFKLLVSKSVGASIWQRGYYDHIIRNESDYLIHWQYIEDNPAKWCDDPYFAGI